MSRSLTTAVDAALAASHVTMVLLLELYFDSGTFYQALAGYNISWNGHTYIASGNLAMIEPVAETAELEMTGMVGTLIADSTHIAAALIEKIQGRSVILRLAPMDTATHQVLADPVVVFSGRMDTMAIELGAKSAIKVTAESRFADWDRPRIKRYNHEDQLALHPTDYFFEFVPQMAEKQLNWGVVGATNNPTGLGILTTILGIVH